MWLSPLTVVYILWGTSYEGTLLDLISFYGKKRASPVAQTVRDLPARQETQVQSQSWEGPQRHWSGYPL